MTTAETKRPGFPLYKAILITGFIAGTLDILAAIFMSTVILHRSTAVRVLQSVASGAFGREAYEGGTAMALAGLGFHYLNAYLFTIFYFLVYPYIPFLQKHKIVSGLIYGILVWVVMNLVVLPLSAVPTVNYQWKVIARGAGVLILCIGLPISLLTAWFYSKRGKVG